MKLLILSHRDVEHLLPMNECIAVMEDALAALARGDVHNPLRNVIRAEGAPGFLGLMPAWRGGATPSYGLKEVCVFPGNPARGLDTHLGAVLLHSGDTGQLLAVINASAITAIRTAAVSAVATKLLARPDSSSLAILGAGVQARSHLEAIPLVRPIREIRVFGRSPQRVEALIHDFDGRDGLHVAAASSAEQAVRGADVIVTATSSKEPVVHRDWIAEGAHINAAGSSVAHARELDAATVAASSLFVDRRESTVNESGDYLFALREGAIAGPDHIRAELGELLIGSATGRSSAAEITLFKSLGLAIEDLACAQYLYAKCEGGKGGSWIEFD
ncbi:MAG TPA: ornithine cyclodeaminase family protein [Thermoanaerobaculia bacterium]|nr:ornithine cyclodeaminase family protein [Thermoanaerobaculia bacterium]